MSNTRRSPVPLSPPAPEFTKWNKEAEAAGVVRRVSSMCDLFEEFDGRVVDQQNKPVEMKHHKGRFWTVPLLRARVFQLIEETPWLEWLLLTKRPQNVTTMVPPAWLTRWPTNVMTGTSPCDQETADASIPDLLKVPGRRFLSCEPMIGPVNLRRIKTGRSEWTNVLSGTFEALDTIDGGAIVGSGPKVHWVITGGESGGGQRDCEPAWQESIVAQCKAEGVPVFIKQDSGLKPSKQGRLSDAAWAFKQHPVSHVPAAVS